MGLSPGQPLRALGGQGLQDPKGGPRGSRTSWAWDAQRNHPAGWFCSHQPGTRLVLGGLVTRAQSPWSHAGPEGWHYLLLALLQPSFLYQADELLAVLVAHHSAAAIGDQLHHALVTQHCCVSKLSAKHKLKGFPVHPLQHLQQLYLQPQRAKTVTAEPEQSRELTALCCWIPAPLTSSESTAAKSLLQLTSSPDSCFHTSAGRESICRREQPQVSFLCLSFTRGQPLCPSHNGPCQATSLAGKALPCSPETPCSSGLLPSAARSTHTWGSPCMRGWGRTCPWSHCCCYPGGERLTICRHRCNQPSTVPPAALSPSLLCLPLLPFTPLQEISTTQVQTKPSSQQPWKH